MTAVAFMAGSLGFIGCGGIDEDPDAKANQDKEEEFADEPGDSDDLIDTTTDPGGTFGAPDKKD